MEKVDFVKGVGLDGQTCDFLNWCLLHRNNLEVVKKFGVMEIWQEKSEEGNAVLNFNRAGKLLRVNKNLFS